MDSIEAIKTMKNLIKVFECEIADYKISWVEDVDVLIINNETNIKALEFSIQCIKDNKEISDAVYCAKNETI